MAAVSFLCVLHALINCAYMNERGRPGTEARNSSHLYIKTHTQFYCGGMGLSMQAEHH